MVPKVSVIVPVYNCRASVRRSLDSVFDQSLDPDQIQLIVVDDGSTDGTAALLDTLADEHPNLTVIHQPNSGGPGHPRNTGIDHADGTYLFFLDADDYLAPEALERMTAMADTHHTDVVLGKMVGVGRRIPPGLFVRDVPRTTITNRNPSPYDTLNPLKLFRRSVIDHHHIRFAEGVFSHEDQIFTARAYLHASGISILASYDCYYWVDREDGTSAIQQGGAGAGTLFPVIDEVMTAIAEQIPEGPDRDWLHRRHFRDEIFPRFGPRYLTKTPEEQQATRDGARRLLDKWFTPWIRNGTHPYRRIIAHCLQHDVPLIDDIIQARADHGGDPPNVLHTDGRAYAAYPHLHSGLIPDACYDVTDRVTLHTTLTDLTWNAHGHLQLTADAALENVLDASGPRVSITLRRTTGEDPEVTVECQATEAGFTAALDLATLASGTWEVHLDYAIGQVTRRAKLAKAEDGPVEDVNPRVEPGSPIVSPQFTAKGELRISVGAVSVTDVRSTRQQRLTLCGHITDPLPQHFNAELRRRGSEEAHPVPATLDSAGGFTLDVGLRGLEPGRWDLRCQTDETWHRVPLPRKALEALDVAEVYTTIHGGFAVTVTPGKPIGRAGRLLRRVSLTRR